MLVFRIFAKNTKERESFVHVALGIWKTFQMKKKNRKVEKNKV